MMRLKGISERVLIFLIFVVLLSCNKERTDVSKSNVTQKNRNSLGVASIGDGKGKPRKNSAVPSPLVDDRHKANIILIILDTLRADKMGIYQFPHDTSLELDNLARNGIVFKRAISQCSWTRPSIGSMLTGIYPRKLGMYHEKGDALPEDAETLAEVLRANGYTTIGVTANPNINGVFRFDQGFEFYRNSTKVFGFMPHRKKRKVVRAKRGQLMSANKVFDIALRQIQKRNRPPYYVQLNLMEIHTVGASIRRSFKSLYPEFEPRQRNYLQALRQLSFDTAEFLKKLYEKPQFEDTLVVITSDHGQGLGDHPGIPGGDSHGSLLYESQVWVPLILHHSNSKLGKAVIERPVRIMDIVPTVLDFLHIKPLRHIDGRSLLALIENPRAKTDLPKYFVTETNFRNVNKVAVYSDKWKYFENRDNWPGLNPRELQPANALEMGKKSDEIDKNKDVSNDLQRYLLEWEKQNPKRKPTPPRTPLPKGMIQQLKAIGYLQ